MIEFMDLLKDINIGQLLAMGAMLWFFYSMLDAKIEKLDAKIEKLSDKIDKLDEKVNQIDKRLVAVETLLSVKGCCVLKDSDNLKKAE